MDDQEKSSGSALQNDMALFAFSKNNSYFAISHKDEILIAIFNSSTYQYRFAISAIGKVISLSWSDDHDHKLSYHVYGNSEIQKGIIPEAGRNPKNIKDDDTALTPHKLYGHNSSNGQITTVEGLDLTKLLFEKTHQELCKRSQLLPYELVQHITLSMSIGGAENAVEAMLKLTATEDKEIILRERCNPLLFLREIFDNPERLLDLMRSTGAIISGSRAAEYFRPGACVSDSDVDFYCPSDIETVAIFTYHLSLMGVEWSIVEPRTEDGEFLDYFSMKLRLLKGTLSHKGRIFYIQCIWSESQRRTATSIIFQFHSTPVQCFISGFAAVSLYDEYTSLDQAIHWPANDKNTARGQRHRIYQQVGRLSVREEGLVDEYIPIRDESRNELKIIEKYSGRGFQFVKYFSRGPLAHGGGNEIGYYGGRFRSVGDTGCRRVSFKPYIKHTDWQIPFDVYYRALNYISWYETEYKTTSTQGVLDDDFPYHCKGSQIDIDWSGPNQIFDPMESLYASEMVINHRAVRIPWLGDNFVFDDKLPKFFYAYRYPC